MHKLNRSPEFPITHREKDTRMFVFEYKCHERVMVVQWSSEGKKVEISDSL